MDKIFITQQQLSDLLYVSERTLERWRVEGVGPPFLKAGKKVLYLTKDIDDWLLGSGPIN